MQALLAALAYGTCQVQLQALAAAASPPFRIAGRTSEELQAARRDHVRVVRAVEQG